MVEYIPDPRAFDYNRFHNDIATEVVQQLQGKEILLPWSGK